MDMTIDQQVALDEALIPHASRLRIRKSNFRLRSDITSKESTLQLVYDVLRLTPFYKAFLFIADVPEIYTQEFWATAIVHHHSIRFKMDNMKHIFNLEYFREMLHICPRLSGQTFDELPFEEEILAFLKFLRQSGEIKKLTDVNINKLHQPWRSFAAVINKWLSRKSTGYANFVYQVEHKDAKKSNKMYYPWFTKIIIHYFMTKDPLIPRRNKVNWHYVRDDEMFTMIKLVSRHQNTQQFGVILHVELTNEDIRNSEAYKEYYAVPSGAAPPKTKASVRKTKSSSDTTITPPTAAGTRLSTSAKGKQIAKSSKAKGLTVLYEVAMTEAEQMKLAMKRSLQQTHISQASGSGVDEGTGNIQGVPDVPTDESDEEISRKSSDEDDDDEVDERSDDQDEDDDQDDDDQDDNDDDQDTDNDDVNINQGRGLQATLEVEYTHVTLTPVKPDGQQESSSVLSQFVTSMLNPTLDVGMESIFETTSRIDVQTPTSVAPLPIITPTMASSTIATTTTTSQPPILPTTVLSDIIQHIPSFGSLFCFDDRLRYLEENFSEVMQTNQFAGAVSAIPEIVQHYMDQRMNEAVKVAVQIQSDWLRDEAQRENDKILRTVDENIKKIIKEKVKEQVKVQVSKILSRIEQAVNEQLKAEVLTRSSHSSRTSYDVAADLSEMELKKILIEKMEGNKSIQRSDEQRNLYKALVEAYESDKIFLDTYGEMVTLKRRRDDDEDKDEEPSAGPDRGSTTGSRSRQASASESAFAEEPHPEWFSQPQKPPTLDRDWNKTLPAVHGSIQPWISELAKQADTRSYFNELMDTPLDFSNFIMNRLRVDTLTLKLLDGPTYDLMKGSCKSLIELEYHLEEVYKATTNQLDWVNPEESARDVYSKRRIIAVTELKIVEWHSYKHLDWITVRCDDDKLYKFKEGDYKRLRIQYIEDMLLLLVQGELTNLTVEEYFAFNVSLRMFTRSIVIQRCMEDLQLGVESYQKRLNLTKPNTYRSDLKRKEAYTAYSNP
nr:hypothetical protein [Tanacetum cinerariifolium]